jgi:hypothetical protein
VLKRKKWGIRISLLDRPSDVAFELSVLGVGNGFSDLIPSSAIDAQHRSRDRRRGLVTMLRRKRRLVTVVPQSAEDLATPSRA